MPLPSVPQLSPLLPAAVAAFAVAHTNAASGILANLDPHNQFQPCGPDWRQG